MINSLNTRECLLKSILALIRECHKIKSCTREYGTRECLNHDVANDLHSITWMHWTPPRRLALQCVHLLLETVGVLLHVIIPLAAAIRSLKQEKNQLKSDQKIKDQNSKANIMLLKNKYNIQKSKVGDFEVLVKRLSNDFADVSTLPWSSAT